MAELFWKNPILGRELLDRLRSTKTFLTMFSVALAASGLVYLRWPSDSRLDVISQGSMNVFRPLAYGLTLAAILLVPAFPATSLVQERRRGTLALLLNSPLLPIHIYLGKLLSNIVLAILLLSVSLPALSACIAMGGISIRHQLVPFILVLLGMIVQYTAVGLWISIRSNSSDTSLRWTYATVLGLSVLTLAPTVFVGKLGGMRGWIAHWLTALSPISALQQITANQSTVREFGIATGWQDFLIATLIVSIILGLMTLLKLDPILLDRAKPQGKIVLDHGGAAGWIRRITYLVDPEKRKSGIPFWINPIMVKEFRTRKFGRLHWLIRLVSGCAVASLALTVLSATGSVSWGVERIAGSMVFLQVALLILLGPSLSSSLIAGEIESGGWQILRMTPLWPLRILSGKLMSVVWTMLLTLLATLPGYVVMAYIQPAMMGQIGNVLISLGCVAAIVIAISALISGLVRTTATATAISYVVLILLFAGTLLVWMARGQPFGPTLVQSVLRFNPAAAALAEINTPGFESYQLTPHCWWISITIAFMCLVGLTVRTLKISRPD